MSALPDNLPPGAWVPGPPPLSRRSLSGLGTVALVLLMLGVGLLAALSVTPSPTVPTPAATRAEDVDAVIVGGTPIAWDPAAIGDAASAGTLAQVWEGLTAFDVDAHVRPALATGWRLEDRGRRIVFTMRPGITFSDGSPITASDVVRSWLRVLDPRTPSPLSGLLGEVRGARAYLAGQGRATDVGLQADGDQVIVSFDRPASYFPAAVASPTLAIVPATLPDGIGTPLLPDGLVVSGAYLPSAQTGAGLTLTANPRYWAGAPALGTITLVTDLAGRSPVDVFQSGEIDYTPIGSVDASWIRYDRDLGPQLRRSVDFSVEYYGFDTSRPPFSDVDVRRAFATAIDWRRLVLLADPDAVTATSMVPAGIEGRGDGDFLPAADPDGARAALARAGFPGGAGFPDVTLVTNDAPYDQAVVTQLRAVLGVDLSVETMPFDEYSARLDSDPPMMWSLDWIADYPHPQDFLELLLETGSGNNVGRWSDAGFDAALSAAASTDDADTQERHYTEAQAIVQDQAPVIPLRYGESWALSRDGLLGAAQSGIGIVRFAGLAWAGR